MVLMNNNFFFLLVSVSVLCLGLFPFEPPRWGLFWTALSLQATTFRSVSGMQSLMHRCWSRSLVGHNWLGRPSARETPNQTHTFPETVFPQVVNKCMWCILHLAETNWCNVGDGKELRFLGKFEHMSLANVNNELRLHVVYKKMLLLLTSTSLAWAMITWWVQQKEAKADLQSHSCMLRNPNENCWQLILWTQCSQSVLLLFHS